MPSRNRKDKPKLEAIFKQICHKQKWVLDADIAKCFDKINHNYLLEKLGDTLVIFKRQVKAWLKSGYIENKKLFPSDEGTPQGGVISPLLANIALHGIENHLNEWVITWKGRKKDNLKSFSFIRYADDFVCIHESKQVVEEAKRRIEEYLQPIGLVLKPEKTQIVHTSKGLDFLSYNVRQYKVGYHQSGKISNGDRLGFKTLTKPSKKTIKKHYDKMADTIRSNKSVSQEALINQLNPIIRGWCNYNSNAVSSEIFSKLDHLLYGILRRWTSRKHPNKKKKWVKEKYRKTAITKTFDGLGIKARNWTFKTDKGSELVKHLDVPIVRHVKVEGDKSPYDGDKVYWGKRLSQSKELTTREQNLLKKQKGKCAICHKEFKTGDIWEIDHIKPRCKGGKDTYDNLQLVHAHCHDQKTRTDGSQKPRYS